MSSEAPLVSVIIPVYNVESYLGETLQSLQNQSYRNLDVVLVDDGSSDRSGSVCDEYCDRDPRFRVFHTANHGASSARNFALDHTLGEYCFFLDADDLILPTCIETLLSSALSRSSDIVTCGFMIGLFHPVQEFAAYRPASDPAVFEVPIESFRYTSKTHMHDTMSAALFRTSLIGDLRFPQGYYVGEDTVLFSRLIRKARKLVYIDEPLYYYRYRSDSLSNASYNPLQATEIDAWECVCSEARDESPDFFNECCVALALRCKKNYELAYKANYPDRELYRSMHARCCSLRSCVMKSKERTFAEKQKYLLYLLFPNLFLFLKKSYKKESF